MVLVKLLQELLVSQVIIILVSKTQHYFDNNIISAVEEVLDPLTNELVAERTYGCLPADEGGFMQCKGHLVPHFEPRNIACCSDQDLCNKDLVPVYQPSTDHETGVSDQLHPSVYHIALLVSLTTCLVIFILLVTFAYLRYKHRYTCQTFNIHDCFAGMPFSNKLRVIVVLACEVKTKHLPSQLFKLRVCLQRKSSYYLSHLVYQGGQETEVHVRVRRRQEVAAGAGRNAGSQHALRADRAELRLRVWSASPGAENHRQADTHGEQRGQGQVRRGLAGQVEGGEGGGQGVLHDRGGLLVQRD